MRGLLLKDWYLIKKYCWMLYLMDVLFIALSLFATDSVFIYMYPYLFAGFVPMTLYAYDERERWKVYAAALPVSRRQYVSGKYLVGLLSIAAVLLLSLVVHTAVYLTVPGRMVDYLLDFLSILPACAAMGFITPALSLPLMFRFGSEKARIAYIVILAGIASISSVFLGARWNIPPAVSLPPILVYAAAPVLYLLSWALSMAIYEKREL